MAFVPFASRQVSSKGSFVYVSLVDDCTEECTDGVCKASVFRTCGNERLQKNEYSEVTDRISEKVSAHFTVSSQQLFPGVLDCSPRKQEEKDLYFSIQGLEEWLQRSNMTAIQNRQEINESSAHVEPKVKQLERDNHCEDSESDESVEGGWEKLVSGISGKLTSIVECIRVSRPCPYS